MNHVIRYKSAVTGLTMYVESIGPDEEQGSEFGRNIRGCRTAINAMQLTPKLAEETLPKVREIHRDAWIERADGSRIQPYSADME